MAKFEQLRTPFLSLPEEERHHTLLIHREERSQRLSQLMIKLTTPKTSSKKGAKKKDKLKTVTPEQFELLKKLGLI